MKRTRSARASGVALAALHVAFVLATTSSLAAQASAPSAAPSSAIAARYAYREGAQTRTILVEPNGALALEVDGRLVPTALGTDRVIVVGAHDPARLAALELELDEVLGARAGIVAVRSARSGEHALALAARLAPWVERGLFEGASPDLAFAHERRDIAIPPNDPRLPGQWFYETIHMRDAWAREDGDPSVTIAIVDDGCDLSHPDLVSKLLPGYDAVDDDDDPSYLPGVASNEHGTACAGLAAAATDNGVDVAGTCPECSLRCVRLLGAPGELTPTSTDVRAFEFVLSHEDVAVVSNSWGFSAGVPAPLALVRQIETVMREGRGGRGAIVVFAAGNDAQVIGPSELQAIPGVVTVGAINTFDEAASFSNSGACVALVAPTGTLTTDISGPDGADPGDVTTRFGGTSSACPIVAGVFGLLVSAAPDRTADALRELLVESVRPAPFAVPDERGHDLTYGYGIVDPSAALARLGGEADAGPSAVDAGAAGADDAGTMSPATEEGCACRVGARRAPSRPLALALASMLALLLARRRRSRSGSAALLALGLSLVVVGCDAERREARPTVVELRPDTPGSTELPPRYDASDVVESVVSPGGAFRVHFTRAGRHAVPLADADMDGVPDHVALVAETYDAVLDRYLAMGFRSPLGDADVPTDNGGDALFDVYLLDFGSTGSDGAFRRERCSGMGCSGYMIQDNDFAGSSYPSVRYGIRVLASHELFHAVQAAYVGDADAQGSVLSEGSAVWASERFDPSLSDLELLGYGYTTRTDRSLGVDPATAGGAYTYGTGLVFEYLGARYGDELVRELFEDLERSGGSSWLEVLDARIRSSHGSSFEEAFVGLAEWLVFLGPRADAAHGLGSGGLVEPVAAMLVTDPYLDARVRMFPAAIRYYAVEGGQLHVALGGAEAEGLDVIAVAFDGTRYLATARGRGGVSIDEPSATLTFIAIADARASGSSRVVSLCIAGDVTACALEPDAGAGADAGVPADAAVASEDGGAPSPAGGDCSCRVAPREGSGAGLLVVALGLALSWRRARRARR